MPSMCLVGLIIWKSDACVLAISGSDQDWGMILEKAIYLPIMWSMIYPMMITVDYEVV